MKQNLFTKLHDKLRDKENRNRVFLFLILVLLIIIILPLFAYERSLKISLQSYKQKYNDLIILSKDYMLLKGRIETVEKKQSSLSKTGIANIANDIFASLGIKGKVKNITEISNRQLAGNISMESAEIHFEKLTMNEMVNLFHKIETSNAILSVKKAGIKKSFEKPELLDVKITLALFNLPSPVQP